VIRIAVSPRAYRAIKGTLPEGSVVYAPERNSRGQYLLWLTEADWLSAIRKPGNRWARRSTGSRAVSAAAT
jgi:hypothetical protein